MKSLFYVMRHLLHLYKNKLGISGEGAEEVVGIS